MNMHVYLRAQAIRFVDDAPEDLDIAADHDAIELYDLENLIASLPLSLREPFLLQTLGGTRSEIAENSTPPRAPSWFV